MNNIEILFFENYKKLDNLCKDILNAEQGVTSYINEMERTPLGKRRFVPTWEVDYKNLKHVRWIRNDIAHGNGASVCEQTDIDFVVSFYQRIMNQTDPFGIIHKRESVKSVSQKKTIHPSQTVSQVNYNPINTSYDCNGNANDSIAVKLLIGIIIIVVLLIVYMYMN